MNRFLIYLKEEILHIVSKHILNLKREEIILLSCAYKQVVLDSSLFVSKTSNTQNRKKCFLNCVRDTIYKSKGNCNNGNTDFNTDKNSHVLKIKSYVDNFLQILTKLEEKLLHKYWKTYEYFYMIFTKHLPSFIENICNLKLFYFYQNKKLEQKLQNSIDNFSNYYNIHLILHSQQEQLTNENILIKSQEEMKNLCLCINCKIHTRNIVLLPCMHYILCKLCSSDVNDCPVCNNKIVNKKLIEL
jgi:hypothetical protein